MKVLNYRDIGNDWLSYRPVAEAAVNDYMIFQDPLIGSSNAKITSVSLAHLMAAFGSSDLEGRTILDLGCGSRNSDGGDLRLQHPHLCRVLRRMGAKPVGIDINDSLEGFEFYSADLSKPGALDFLRGRNFDAAHSRGLFDSSFAFHSGKTSPEALFRNVVSGLSGVVVPDGFFLWGNNEDRGNLREERK